MWGKNGKVLVCGKRYGKFAWERKEKKIRYNHLCCFNWLLKKATQATVMLRIPFCVSSYHNISRQHNEAGQAAREEAPIVGWKIRSGRIKRDNLYISVKSCWGSLVSASLLFGPLLRSVGAAQQAQSVRQSTHKRVRALSAPPRPLLSATCRALPPPIPSLSFSLTLPAFLSSSRVLLSFSARSLQGGVWLECQESLE